MALSDRQIADALIARDEHITHEFFWVWCRPLMYSLISKIFDYEVDYDELIGALYLHLMEDNARRLRSFEGRSSIYQWLKCVAARFFIEKRDEVIENESSEPLYPSDEPYYEPGAKDDIRRDVRELLARMPNPRYRMVLQKLLLEEVEYEELATQMGITVANLYNIKRRALSEFAAIVVKEYANGKD